jgi:hypothetical protein
MSVPKINSGRASPTQLAGPPLVANAELGQVLPPGAKVPLRPGNYLKVRNLEDPPNLIGKPYRKGMAAPIAKQSPPHIAINVAPPKKTCTVCGGFLKTKESVRTKEFLKTKQSLKTRRTTKKSRKTRKAKK